MAKPKSWEIIWSCTSAEAQDAFNVYSVEATTWRLAFLNMHGSEDFQVQTQQLLLGDSRIAKSWTIANATVVHSGDCVYLIRCKSIAVKLH